jgi:hypothetical protein
MGSVVNMKATSRVDDGSPSSVVLKADPGIDTAEVSRFLTEVFGRAAGHAEICMFPNGARAPRPLFIRMGQEITRDTDGSTYLTSPDTVAPQVALIDERGLRTRTDAERAAYGERVGVDAWYVRATTLATEPQSGQRGGASNIREFFGFWLDGDFAVDGHHKTEGMTQETRDGAVVLPPDADAVRALWRAAGYPEPSVEWMTGGGVNGLWLLENPVVVEDGPDGAHAYAELKAASKRWHERVRMLAAQEGFHHDTTHNLDRLLRLPGSVNRKVMHHPKAVTAVYSGARYRLEELLDLIPEPVRTDDGALIDPVSGVLLREAPPVTASERRRQAGADGGGPIEGLSPWDDFDARADWWGDVLGVLGFQHHSWSGQTENLTRPGKEVRDGQSATLNHDGLDKLYIFSDTVERMYHSVKPFTGQYLTKSQALCHMVHGGDWAQLAQDLRGRGYGDALPERKAPTVSDEELFPGQLDGSGQFTGGPDAATEAEQEQDTVVAQTPLREVITGPASKSGHRLIAIRASQIKLKRTLWMWDTTPEGGVPTSGGRIPKDMLTVAAGLPGTGKSQYAIWMTAEVTKGTLPGCHYGTPQSVIYCATEDDWERTIAPRLVAAGADMERVLHVAVQDVEVGGTVKLQVPQHCDALGQLAQQEEVALVVLDPLLSHIGGKVNANTEKEVRDALEPLVKAAAKYNFTVLGLSHFNKNSSNSDPMERLMGSRGFSALLRALIVFAKDKDAEEGDAEVPAQKFVLSQAKNNLGRTDMPSYSYTIASAVVETEEGDAYVSRFVLGPESDTSVEEQLGTASRSAEEQAAGQDCKSWLKSYLQHHGGEDYQQDIMKAAEKEGFPRSTLYRAKTALKIEGKSSGFASAKTAVWRLPGAITQGRKAEAAETAMTPKRTAGTGTGTGADVSYTELAERAAQNGGAVNGRLGSGPKVWQAKSLLEEEERE